MVRTRGRTRGERLSVVGRPSNNATRTIDVVGVLYNSRARLRACAQPLTHVPCKGVALAENASPNESALNAARAALGAVRSVGDAV